MFDHTFAAYIYTLFASIVVLFQLGLACGLPWGELAMGGKFPQQYPPRMRIAALVMIVVLVMVTMVVLTRAKLICEPYYHLSEYAIWGVVIFSALGAVMNLITPSKKERMLWMPIATIMLVCVVYIAIN